MILYGASGHAKVVMECLVASGQKITAIFDDNESIKTLLGVEVRGKYQDGLFKDEPRIISIGSNRTREKIAAQIHCAFGIAIHPTATISSTASIAEGSVVMGHCIINADTKIGKHVILNTSSSIDHDCLIHDFVHISPGAVVCGGVTVGVGSHIGAGATVIQNIKIGQWALIGAGAVVIENVPDYAVVTGVPGKVIRFQTSAY